MKSVECFIDAISNDPVDEVRILRKIFEAYESTMEAALTVSTACDASIHKPSWALVVRHASQVNNADDIVRDANVLLTKEQKQGRLSVDPLLERAANFTACVFRPDFDHDQASELLRELRPNIRDRAQELGKLGYSKKAKMYRQALQAYEDIYNGDLRAKVGDAFIMTLEAYQSRSHFVAPKRITIDDFVNTLKDCDIRLGKVPKDEEVPEYYGGYWHDDQSPQGLHMADYFEIGGEDEKKKEQLEAEEGVEVIGDHPSFKFDVQQDKE